MDVIAYIILLAVSGLLIGALARLLLIGPDPMSLLETMLAGIGGSLIAGLVAYYVSRLLLPRLPRLLAARLDRPHGAADLIVRAF